MGAFLSSDTWCRKCKAEIVEELTGLAGELKRIKDGKLVLYASGDLNHTIWLSVITGFIVVVVMPLLVYIYYATSCGKGAAGYAQTQPGSYSPGPIYNGLRSGKTVANASLPDHKSVATALTTNPTSADHSARSATAGLLSSAHSGHNTPSTRPIPSSASVLPSGAPSSLKEGPSDSNYSIMSRRAGTSAQSALVSGANLSARIKVSEDKANSSSSKRRRGSTH